MNPVASPRVSVVTVVRNGAAGIGCTIESALAQRGVDRELVIVDGDSRDGTQRIVEGFGAQVDCFLSEPDRGVYDAMNKGVARARGEFVLMMNAGDRFASPDALMTALAATEAGSAHQLVFGGWVRESAGGRRTVCRPQPERRLFNHQAVLYSRALHQRFGEYVSVPGFTTADYLFFCTVLADPAVRCRVVEDILAVVDIGGLSAGLQTMSQRTAIDYLFGGAGRGRVAAVMTLHPAYHALKRRLRGAR